MVSSGPIPHQQASSPWYRLGPVLVAAAVYLFFMARPEHWNAVIWPYSMARYGAPFVDMQGHLASSQAFADGTLQPGQPVPGDTMNRIHAGPTWMLWPGHLGLGPQHTLPFVAFCISLFLTTAACFVRPTGLPAALYLFAGLTGPPLLLLVERGNIDLLVFVMLSLAFTWLASAAALARWLGWITITLFIGFKYYPALAYASLLEARTTRREKLLGLGLGLLASAAFIGLTFSEIRYVGAHQVENTYAPFFGARELLVLSGLTHASASRVGLGLLVLLALLFARLLGPLTSIETSPDSRRIGFLGGGAILVFCFVATSSPDYRLVFFLFCLPWLWSLASRVTGASRGLRMAATTCLALFVALPWAGTLLPRVALALDSMILWRLIILGKQLGWWLLMTCLGALVLRQVLAGMHPLLRPPPAFVSPTPP